MSYPPCKAVLATLLAVIVSDDSVYCIPDDEGRQRMHDYVRAHNITYRDVLLALRPQLLDDEQYYAIGSIHVGDAPR